MMQLLTCHSRFQLRATDHDIIIEYQWMVVTHYVITQCSFRTALKKFPARTEKEACKELLQLHEQETFAPQDVRELS